MHAAPTVEVVGKSTWTVEAVAHVTAAPSVEVAAKTTGIVPV